MALSDRRKLATATFVLSPFGIAAATLLVTHLRGEEFRPPIAHFDEMAALVSISAMLYGMVAVIAELIGGRVVFYTLSQIGKALRAVKAEHEAEFIEKMRTDPAYRAEVLDGVTEHEAEIIEKIRTDPKYRANILAGVETDGRRRHRRRLRSTASVDDEAR